MDIVDDMNCLHELTEGSLLRNLKIRYENNQIYVIDKFFKT
jgi:myosin heavy subunit